MHTLHSVTLICLLLTVTAASARAQETRVEAQEQREAEKAKSLAPQQLSKWEERFIGYKNGFIEPQGFGVAVGSIYSGSWFALGPSYRRILNEETTLLARGMYSVRGYALVDALLLSLGLADGRLDLVGTGRWMDAKDVSFFGLGPTSSQEDETNFRFQETSAAGGVTYRPVKFVVLSGGLGYESYDTKTGVGPRPSIEELFDADSVPGLGADPEFIHTRVGAGIDWRTSPGYSRRGGLYRAELNTFRDTNGPYDFDRLEVGLVQHVPFFRENIVLSFQGRLQTTLDEDDQVPYFMMPALGGGRALRGYKSFRFRGLHSLLLSSEYRWIPNRWALDMALFFEAGKVTMDRDDLDLRDLKTDVGVGVRFHAPLATVLRLELARGDEGFRFIFAVTPPF